MTRSPLRKHDLESAKSQVIRLTSRRDDQRDARESQERRARLGRRHLEV